MSKHTAEVIIIGGGVNGCAAAYYLAKAGMKDVIVLEGSPSIGHGGSSRNGGGVRQSGRDVRELPYAMYAVQNMWPTLSEELGVDVEYYQKEKLGITFVYVTHDQEEALTMSDRIAVMHQEHFEQIGTAKEIYENPQTKFVASFIGESNIFEANVDTIEGTDLGLTMENGKVRAKGEGFVKEEIVYISVRPENTHLSDKPVDGFTLKGIVSESGSSPEHLSYLQAPSIWSIRVLLI